MLYTSRASAPEGTGLAGVWPLIEKQPTDQGKYYKSETRCIDPIAIVTSINTALLDASAASSITLYDDQVPDSCLLGLELNDPSCMLICFRSPILCNSDFFLDQLSLSAPMPPQRGPPAKWVRQLWTGPNSDTLFHPTAALSVKVSKAGLSLSSQQSGKFIPLEALPVSKHSKAGDLPNIPIAIRLNASRIIPGPNLSLGSKVAMASLSGTITEPQFTLILHPDYRPPPPTPFRATGSNIYAPMDFRTYNRIIL